MTFSPKRNIIISVEKVQIRQINYENNVSSVDNDYSLLKDSFKDILLQHPDRRGIGGLSGGDRRSGGAFGGGHGSDRRVQGGVGGIGHRRGNQRCEQGQQGGPVPVLQLHAGFRVSGERGAVPGGQGRERHGLWLCDGQGAEVQSGQQQNEQDREVSQSGGRPVRQEQEAELCGQYRGRHADRMH